MREIYISKIHIKESRNILDLTIPLSNEERKHLIITGKNGSGKTSLLNDLNIFLQQVDNGNYGAYENQMQELKNQKKSIKDLTTQKEKRKEFFKESPQEEDQINANIEAQQNYLNDLKKWFNMFGSVEVHFKNYKKVNFATLSGDYLIAYFDAKRHTNLIVPSSITKVNLKTKYSIAEKVNKDFIQYIVNMKADRSFARDDGEMEIVRQIDDWFTRFEKRLQILFQSPKLILKFNRKSYNFDIIEGNKLPFTFNTLADGYSAIISIATELLLRMEGHGARAYDLQGVVLIDEIETHLHVDLQKKVLPFLIDFFPKIQFIITTHSPFVLSSIPNAVICDLEEEIVTEDLSAYSYDALIESYFNTDKYSEQVKNNILRFEKLASTDKLKPDEKDELKHLRNYFVHAPKYLSNELMVKLQQIELQNLPKKDSKK